MLKSEKETNYLILPLVVMEEKVHAKAILDITSYDKYRVKIDIREGNIYLGNRNHEMNYYRNNWGVIK